MEDIRIDDKKITVQVEWQFTRDKHPLWDKLWEKLLSPLPGGAIQTDPNGLGYDHQILGGEP